MTGHPRIGVVPGYFHPDPKRPTYKNKTLLYVDEAITRWLQSAGAFPMLLPTPEANLPVDAIIDAIDGLLLQGGPDVSPESYGEKPKRKQWRGDAVRDRYELKLIRASIERGVPVLGVCRGAQCLNVALGGTLHQDISTQVEGALAHRDAGIYDGNFHEIEFVEGSDLSRLYGGLRRARVNSIHHQAVKEPAPGLEVEARSSADGVIEAIRLTAPGRYARGVQWHPEWMDPGDDALLPTRPLLDDFLNAVGESSPHA